LPSPRKSPFGFAPATASSLVPPRGPVRYPQADMPRGVVTLEQRLAPKDGEIRIERSGQRSIGLIEQPLGKGTRNSKLAGACRRPICYPQIKVARSIISTKQRLIAEYSKIGNYKNSIPSSWDPNREQPSRISPRSRNLVSACSRWLRLPRSRVSRRRSRRSPTG